MMTLEHYLQQHYTPATAKAYQREIAIYLSNCKEADKALYKDITRYIGALRNRYNKPATISRILSSLKVYYAYLCDAGIRSDNPAKAITLRDQQPKDIQLQDLFTTQELEVLLNGKQRYHYLDYRNKVLISLLIYQALHPRELQAITVQDINLTSGSIYIKATTTTNSRTLSLKAAQILLFHHYLTEIRTKLLQHNTSNTLLIGIRGEPMKGEDITKYIKRSCQPLYPNKKVNVQTIRQSVIANLLKQGHDLSVVQHFAGHKKPSTTQRYRQNEIQTLKTAIDKYHPFQ